MNEDVCAGLGRSRMMNRFLPPGLPFGRRADLPDTLRDLGRILASAPVCAVWALPRWDLAYCGRRSLRWLLGAPVTNGSGSGLVDLCVKPVALASSH